MLRHLSILGVLVLVITFLGLRGPEMASASEHHEAEHPEALERLSGMLGVRDGTLTVYDDDGEPVRSRDIRWSTSWVYEGRGLGMEIVVFNDEGEPFSHWVSTFYEGDDGSIQTYWVNGSIRRAGYDEITGGSFFAERGDFGDDGVLELVSYQKHSGEEKLVTVRSRYTLEDDGSFVVFDERLDGEEWVAISRFVLAGDQDGASE